MALLHAGKFTEAEGAFSSGAGWTLPVSQSRPSLLTSEFLGDVFLEQGQAEAALKHYDEVFPKAMALVPKGDIVAELRRRRAECYYLLGRHAEAYAEAKLGLEHCRELGDRYEEASTYRVLGLAAAAVNRPGEAKQHFEQGFSYFEDIETPYEWGKLWMSYGDWLRGPHAGEFADTRSALEAYVVARDHFERMGAEAKRKEAYARFAELSLALSAGTLPPDDPPSSTAPPSLIRRPISRRRAESELEQRADWALGAFGILTQHRPLLDLLTMVGKLAKGPSPMLIIGESGTGKELVAHGIHRISGRTGAYMPINCAAIPKDMLESELFGYAAGAFTGAGREKPGLFEVTDGGTVFLDEIGEMSVELQSKLLRFLETGETRRVGATRNVHVNVRIVAATNRDREAMEEGRAFRPDLYYRLAHAVVELPALRARGDDAVLLADQFRDRVCRRDAKHVVFGEDALRQIRSFRWPGNVRQLRSLVERAVMVADAGGTIGTLGLAADQTSVPASFEQEIELVERRRMEEALAQHGGSKTEASRALRMPRTTFLAKMKRYGMRD